MLWQYLRQIRYNRAQGSSYGALFSYFRWKKTIAPNVSSMSKKWPWLTFKAIDFLERNVKADMTVFEYGDGGSTLFWLDRVAKVHTVEHDKLWFVMLQEQIPEKQRSKWNGIFIGADEGDFISNADAANPHHFGSKDLASRGKHYQNYVLAVRSLGTEKVDILLIDGRSRSSCVAYGFEYLKSGGYMIVDNAEREYYFSQNQDVLKDCEVVLDHFGPVPFSSTFSNTRIYRKK